jgi:hypothetical protein
MCISWYIESLLVQKGIKNIFLNYCLLGCDAIVASIIKMEAEY